MTLAFCSRPALISLLANVVPPPIFMSDWRKFQRAAPRAERIVLVVESLIRWPHIEEVRALRRRLPGIPWILVTLGGDANLIELRHFEMEEVARIGDRDRIAIAIHTARVRNLRA